MSDSALPGDAATAVAARVRRDRGGASDRSAGDTDPGPGPKAGANAPGGPT